MALWYGGWVKLSKAIEQAEALRGADPEALAKWREVEGDPLSGEISAGAARVLACGPLEIAADLLEIYQTLHDGYVRMQNSSEDPDAKIVPVKAGDMLAVAKVYLDVRAQAVAGLPLRFEG